LARKNPKCLISTGVFGLYWTSLNFQMGRRPSHKGSYALHTKESRQSILKNTVKNTAAFFLLLFREK